jgi:hypothetical protein
MSYNIHTNDVFDAFVAAKTALDKVPELEAQISSLTATLRTAEQMLDLRASEVRTKQDTIDTLNAKLASLEANLDARTKSNEDLTARLDLVIGTLRGFAGDIGNTLGVVEPKPEPMPEPVAEAASVSTSVDGTTGVSVSSDPTSATSESGPASGSGQSTTKTYDPEPSGLREASRKAKGMDWFDVNGVCHPTAQEVLASPIPFAASTANPSAPAPSTAPTSSEVPVVEPSEDASLPDHPWLKWGYDNT